MLGIWFTAVYASHHYVLDVLAGILCAITAIILFNLMASRVRWFKRFVGGFEKKIQ
jgi:membrane-associated phospholipid phosphatase